MCSTSTGCTILCRPIPAVEVVDTIEQEKNVGLLDFSTANRVCVLTQAAVRCSTFAAGLLIAQSQTVAEIVLSEARLPRVQLNLLQTCIAIVHSCR